MPATEHFFRNQKKLHLVFAGSCVALLASVIAMMVEDYADEWRGIQAKNEELQAVYKARDIAQMTAATQYQAELEALEATKREKAKQLEQYAALEE